MDQEIYWFPYLSSRNVWCIGPGFHYLKLHYHHLFIKVLKILKCSCDHLFRTSMVDCAAVAGGVKIRFSSTACGIYDICLKGLQVRVIRSLKLKAAKLKKNLLMAFKEKCQDSKMTFLFAVSNLRPLAGIGSGLTLIRPDEKANS